MLLMKDFGQGTHLEKPEPPAQSVGPGRPKLAACCCLLWSRGEPTWLQRSSRWGSLEMPEKEEETAAAAAAALAVASICQSPAQAWAHQSGQQCTHRLIPSRSTRTAPGATARPQVGPLTGRERQQCCRRPVQTAGMGRPQAGHRRATPLTGLTRDKGGKWRLRSPGALPPVEAAGSTRTGVAVSGMPSKKKLP